MRCVIHNISYESNVSFEFKIYKVRKVAKMGLHLFSSKVAEQSDSYIKNIDMYSYSAGEDTLNRLFHIPIKNIAKYIFSFIFGITYDKTKIQRIEIQKFLYKIIKI